MSLDFSKMRTAAYGLWSHSNRLFALSGNNALLEFLLDVSLLDIKERDALISRQYALVLMCFGRNLKKLVLNTSYTLLVILFQGAPQLTENYLDSKKVRKAKYLDKLSFDLNLNVHMYRVTLESFWVLFASLLFFSYSILKQHTSKIADTSILKDVCYGLLWPGVQMSSLQLSWLGIWTLNWN